MRKGLLFVLLIGFAIGCSNDDNGDNGFTLSELNLGTSIMFGEIYDQCAGDCRELFLLTEDAIFEDADVESDFGNFTDTVFKSESLSLDKFELSKRLLEIPEELLEFNNEIGNQTIADFDYFVQIEIDSESKIWVFDEINNSISEEIKQYFESLIQVNNALKN